MISELGLELLRRWLQRDINKSNIIFCKFAFEFELEFDFAFEFQFEFDFAFEFEFEFGCDLYSSIGGSSFTG